MKILTISLPLLSIIFLAVSTPALADYYNNGPTNGTSNAFFLNTYGAVSDSFVASGDSRNVFAFAFAEWVPAGATPLTVDWSMGTTSFGNNIAGGIGAAISPTLLCSSGTIYNGGVCGGGLGYDVYYSAVNMDHTVLTSGSTYWLTLTNATDTFGGTDGWDINSGPSMAYHNLLGQVPSESFSFLEETTTTGSTPEPSGIILLGSAILGLGGLLRGKLV